MSSILDLFRTEPTVVIGAIGAVLVAILDAAVAFGAPITADQKTALIGVVSAVGLVVTLYAQRSQVVPVAKASLPASLGKPLP